VLAAITLVVLGSSAAALAVGHLAAEALNEALPVIIWGVLPALLGVDAVI